ncbi:DUF4191 domain-containing protein [Herbiconiux sp. L3-i23]|uniref:DUF4191 domain-containing protein n=1 Tax=Herbiconiux sp. L3-i23 TaxID=2905871 RepID=UPI002063BA08|nr:DUF4191 domain-containing protein [Herbiconiux sp. L3-i23]BDI22898.1 hypothetical protein L3i23_16740 [Herbiconiux sp. L3-i23]
MARPTASSRPAEKEPGRFRQLWQVFQMTRRLDKRAIPYLILVFVLPILVAIGVGIFTAEGNGFVIAIWIVAGVLLGLLLFLIVLGRRAERAAYGQIAGQPGAVGAVLRSSLRRGWRGNEMPVAVNPKTQDAIYRAVGRPGVVLIAEGPKSRTNRMLEEERRKVGRVLPNVPVSTLHVGPDAGSVELHRINRSLGKFKRTLTRAEVVAVSNRLSSLSGNQLPIPKGIDPLRVRPQRMR